MSNNLSLQAVAAIIAALGSLLAGVAGILTALKKDRQPKSKDRPRPPASLKINRLLRMPPFLFGVLLILTGINLAVWLWSSPYLWKSPVPLNVQLTTAAWDALNRTDFPTAAAKARECIDEFEGQALREQEALTASGNPLPPTGAVSADERKRIITRGALNDVATSYLILGQALERMGRPAEAAEAYLKARKFPHARYLGPEGWLISPADVAAGQLDKLSR